MESPQITEMLSNFRFLMKRSTGTPKGLALYMALPTDAPWPLSAGPSTHWHTFEQTTSFLSMQKITPVYRVVLSGETINFVFLYPGAVMEEVFSATMGKTPEIPERDYMIVAAYSD
jgi:hypothetical protein